MPRPRSRQSVTVWYPVGDVNNVKGLIGLKGLKGRDGSDAWVAATGRYATPALGFPVQIGGVIYTVGNLLQSGPDKLYAVRATDGHILWQEPLPLQDASNPANLTIAADSTTVLLSDAQSGLYAVDTVTGMMRWHCRRAIRRNVYPPNRRRGRCYRFPGPRNGGWLGTARGL